MNYWSQGTKEEIIGHEDIEDHDDDCEEIEATEPGCLCRGRGCSNCLL